MFGFLFTKYMQYKIEPKFFRNIEYLMEPDGQMNVWMERDFI